MYKGKDKQTWINEINAYTWEGTYLNVMKRLYPNSLFEIGDIRGSVGEDLYDQIRPYQLVRDSKVYDTKLPFQDALDELEDFKQDELDKIDRVFILIGLFDWVGATERAGKLNMFRSFNELLKYTEENDNLSDLNEVKAADDLINASFNKRQGIREKINRIRLGEEVVALVNYLNDQNNITILQTQAIFANPAVQQIVQALKNGALETAKAAITAIDLTGLDPMDNTYKTEALSIIDDYLGV